MSQILILILCRFVTYVFSETSASCSYNMKLCQAQQLLLEQMSCSSIEQLKQCLDGQKPFCHGDINYHSTYVGLQNLHSSKCSNNPNYSRHSPALQRRPLTRSMFSPSATATATRSPFKTTDYRNNKNDYIKQKTTTNKLDYFQSCLAAAYNFTIHKKVDNHLLNDINYFAQQPSIKRSKRQDELERTKKQFEHHHNNMIYKSQIRPMTPSLTCIIFGDPHLRTFDSRYESCNCLGTRSLLEHPLFDVQITNTRLHDEWINSTGVTKVIVLVRNFAPCAISQELIYETDSLAQTYPAATFTDGSVDNFKNLVYITTSMQNKVVTIHLDHIGVRVYISQFVHTRFLNVVIKFRTATSKHMRQDLVLQSISSISLCKAGCHSKELLDIDQLLKLINIDSSNTDYPRPNYDDNDDNVDSFESPNANDFNIDSNDENHLKKRIIRQNNRKRKNRKNKNKDIKIRRPFSENDNINRPFKISDLVDDFEQASSNRMASIVEDCFKVIGYYRSACLYDMIIKGSTSPFPFLFAYSFDEPRFTTNNSTSVHNFHSQLNPNSTSPSSSSLSPLPLPLTLPLILTLTLTFLQSSSFYQYFSFSCYPIFNL